MNSLLLISPSKGSGFKPILSGDTFDLIVDTNLSFSAGVCHLFPWFNF